MHTTDDWFRLYGEGWKGAIVDEAFSHPAKFSRALIRAIYEHAISEGWLKAGDRVIDPFSGVALGGLDAMRLGMTWIGVELEEKFCVLGRQNIEFWNGQFAGVLPGWGTAVLLQGDSRQLGKVVRDGFSGAVSSPPYAGIEQSGGTTGLKAHGTGLTQKEACFGEYGEEEGQLGAMSEGDFEGVVSSPPFGAGETRDRNPVSPGDVADCIKRAYTQDRQGTTPGNLAHMDACVSSPPYEESMERRGGIDPEKSEHIGGPHSQMNRSDTRYGESEGQLGAMHGGFEAAVSSPPFEDAVGSDDPEKRGGLYRDPKRSGDVNLTGTYGESEGQLGAERAETFWSAARTIVEEIYRLLVPGGVAIWVVKDFIRDKKRVPFAHQWAQLCEACGFEWVHEHRAWVVEDYGTQRGFFGDKDITKARKSFFRRLYEKKYPHNRIDWESVICMGKPRLCQ